jgi:CelD/BcsL family acetyltransferase involved in cellulose biosynthesis
MTAAAANTGPIDDATGVDVRSLTLEETYAYWRQGCNAALRWDCLFVTPPWLEAWHRHFAGGRRLRLIAVFQDRSLIGIAPLVFDGATASFAGDAHVCDYLDFIVTPGCEPLFFKALIGHLRRSGIQALDLRAVRSDAAVFTGLAEAAATEGIFFDSIPENQSLALELPKTWQGYLQGLKGKQRHEVRRKLRRLHESGPIRLRRVDAAGDIESAMDAFAALFTANRQDKSQFWDRTMDAFFRTLAEITARERILKLFFLELNAAAAAAVICFDYNRTRYLYNSGYDRRFADLSVGVLSKVLSIRQAIEEGLERYDFLKGNEVYKERLGGVSWAIYRCRCAL